MKSPTNKKKGEGYKMLRRRKKKNALPDRHVRAAEWLEEKESKWKLQKKHDSPDVTAQTVN